MELNNIESQIREKLSQRKIQPSDNAWDRLDAMLTVIDPTAQELIKPKPKHHYRWMYVAASFIGFVFIASVFFSQIEEVSDVKRQEVVIEEKASSADTVKMDENTKLSIKTATTRNAVVDAKKTDSNLASNNGKKQKTETADDKPEHLNQNQIAENKSENELINYSKVTAINNKIVVNSDQLLASIQMQNNKTAVAKNATKVQVNADDLLAKVDQEIDQSFKEKVLQSVNKKYQEVKVAVANRNFQ